MPTGRLNANAPDYPVWREIFGGDAVPLYFANPTFGRKIDGQERRVTYEIRVPLLSMGQRERLMAHQADLYDISIEEVLEDVRCFGFVAIPRAAIACVERAEP